MDHREEIIDLITMRYSQAESREFFEFEAERIESLIRADLVELGYMNPLRWRAIADTYAELGMLQENFSFGSFLYEADPRFNPRGLYIALAIMLVIIFAGSTLSLFINRVNNRLKQTLSERETARIALAESEKKYRYIAENSSDVIWVLDLEASRFVYISPSIQRLCGFTPEETMGKPTLESIAADSRKLFACALTQNAEKFGQGDKSTYTVEAELLRKNGSTVWSESTIRYAYEEESTRILVLGTTRDITERRLKDEAILHMAQHDGLTDLPNRVLFLESLKQALALAKRKSSSISLMFLDLDGFKPVNDTYGHAIGDLVLKEAARRLKETIRASDAIGRIGGDEFMIYIRDISSKASAVEVAEKIRTSIQSTFFVEGLDIHISSSIGLSIFPDHGTDDAILSLHADAAMYRAKNRGDNQVGIYEENLSG